FRLVYLAFFGPSPAASASQAEHGTGHDASGAWHHAHLHDAPPARAVALIVLAIGSVVAGYVSFGGRFERFLEPSFQGAGEAVEAAAHANELMLIGVSIAAAIAGIGLATYLFLLNRRAADAIADRFAGIHRLLSGKYYVDELYDAAIVQPIRIASEDGLWKGVDATFIDGAVNGVGDTVRGLSELLRRLQTGSVRAYAASLFVGVVVILGYYLWK